MPRTRLYIKQILDWADRHRELTGRWPEAGSAGRVRETLDEHWQNIDACLRVGLRGLRPGGSLARLLAQRRGKRNRKALPKYTIRQILEWSDAHHARNGSWPSGNSGPIANTNGETWSAVDTALYAGMRGLPGGSSIAVLLGAKRNVPYQSQQPRLTIPQILTWADRHAELTGQWPQRSSGRVRDATSERWSAIDSALRNGRRGLPAGGSLARLLTRRRGVRNPSTLPKYTIRQILDWADAHHVQHGAWPNRGSGPIGAAKEETWSAVNGALHLGQRGLPGGSTLAKLLAQERGVRSQFQQPLFSIEQILAWADGYHDRLGNWPTVMSGPVAPSSLETWRKVDKALKNGNRGLAAGSSLPQLLAKSRGVTRHVRQRPLSVDEILQWADAHRARTGQWPISASGSIPEAPGETWWKVGGALLKGQRRLPAGMTITALLAQHRGKRNVQALPKLNIRQILTWADAFRARHGRWPNRDAGPIAGAPGETWCGVTVALSHGGRGLPRGSSLAKLLAAKRGAHYSLYQQPLSAPQILAWADAYHDRTGNWPITHGGPVAGSVEETWSKIDKALRRGGRGLSGGQSLLRLLAQYRGVGRHVRKRKLSVDEILRWADAHRARTGKWPRVTSGPIPEAESVSWQQVNAALLQGKRGLPPGMTIARLLAEKRGVRNVAALPAFSEVQILGWADTYYARRRKWPNNRSGKIAGAPGETWSNVENALRAGVRGLPGGSSLAKFLAAKRAAPHRDQQPRLTIRQILAWADAFHDRTGDWPTVNHGRVGPYTKETWTQIDYALKHGRRGLPGGQSLSMLLADRRRATRFARD